MKGLVYGALVAMFLVASMFFLRYWNRSKDRLFLYFSVAFLLLAPQQLLLGVTQVSGEHLHVLYLIRLAAFLLIIVGIWQKNR